MTKSKSKI